MRTTIRMSEELARRAKEYASRTGRTFTQLVEQAVSEFVTNNKSAKPKRKISLPTAGDPSHTVTDEELQQVMEDMDMEYHMKKLRGGGRARI